MLDKGVWTPRLQRDTEAVTRLQGATETWGAQRSLTQAAAGPEMGGHDGLSTVIPAAVTLHTHVIPDDISVMKYVRRNDPDFITLFLSSIRWCCIHFLWVSVDTKVKRLSMVIIMDLSAYDL